MLNSNILKIMLQEKAHISSVGSQGLLLNEKAADGYKSWSEFYRILYLLIFNSPILLTPLPLGAFIWVGCILHRELQHLRHQCHLHTLLVLVLEHGAQSSFY